MTILVAGAMILRAGGVLLGRRSPHRRICPDTWDLIGGHVEPGETPEEALTRELGEEVGLVPLRMEPLAVIDFSEEAGEPLDYHLFRVDAFLGEPRLMDCEHTDLKWFSLIVAAELPDLASHRYRAMLRDQAARGA